MGSAPTAAEAGVLFGFGKGKPIGTEFAKGWKYQAPSRPPESSSQSKITTKSQYVPFWATIGSDGLPWEPEQEPLQLPLETNQRVDEFLHVPEEPIADSKATLDVLLASLSDKQEVTRQDLVPISALLEPTSHGLNGSDFVGLIQELATRKLSGRAWKYLASMLGSQVDRGLMSTEEVVSVFRLIFEGAEHWEYVSRIFVVDLAKTDQGTLIDVTKYVVSSEDHRGKTKSWLQLLRRAHPAIRDAHVTSQSWERLYSLLAKHFQPSDQHVVGHFGDLRRSELAQILFEFYVPLWLAECTADAGQKPLDVAIHSARDCLRHSLASVEAFDSTGGRSTTIDYGEVKAIALPHRARQENFSSSAPANGVGNLPPCTGSGVQETLGTRFLLSPGGHYIPDTGCYADPYSIVDLVAILARHTVPYTRVLEEAFEIYMQTQSNNVTKNLFLKLRSRKECGIPTSLAEKLMQHFIASGEYDFAFYVFRNTPTLPLLPYADLLIKLIEKGKTHGEKIFDMLLRYHPEECIPKDQREHRGLSLTQEHVDLVHNVAYAFASSAHLSPRTAFRRVWECYRFLRARRAPLQPLISRALVKAGLSRPLTEYMRLSEGQVKYIISIVQQVEGPAIAREVDRIVWDAWEWTLKGRWAGTLLPPSKGPEGQGKYYEKKRRLWMRSGGRVYMPEETLESRNDQNCLEIDESDQENGFVADSIPFESRETAEGTQITLNKTTEFQSSLTEMENVVDAMPPPKKPTNTRVATQFATSQCNTDLAETTGEAIHDIVLFEPFESPLPAESDVDVYGSATSKQWTLESSQAPVTMFPTPRSASRLETDGAADDGLVLKNLSIEGPSTVASLSKMNDAADGQPALKDMSVTRPISESIASSLSNDKLIFKTPSLQRASAKPTTSRVNDVADKPRLHKHLRVKRVPGRFKRVSVVKFNRVSVEATVDNHAAIKRLSSGHVVKRLTIRQL